MFGIGIGIGIGAGMILGMFLNKGLKIEIIRREEKPEKVEYNESLIDELDPEIRSYYDRTNGLNKF